MLRLALVLLAVLTAAPVFAQQPEQQQAERRLQELREQIAQFERQLTSARQEETSAAEALNTIDREIAVREELMQSYNRRLTELNQEAESIEQALMDSERELDRLRQEYARHARQAYTRGRVGDLALILSAESINQMLIRSRHLQRFSERRQSKANEVMQAQDELAARQVRLDSTAAQVQSLLAESRREQSQLATRKTERAQLVTQLRQRRSTLQAEIGRRQEETNRLQARIQQFIAEAEAERRRAAEAERARTAAASAPAEPGRAAAAPAAPAPVAEVSEAEFVRLSGSFRQNRGQLPWPASGVVTEAFGQRRNAVTNTVTYNPGMVLATSPGVPVRAVFGGAVSRTYVMPGYGTCVMISHGDFTTVYCNLSGLNVQQGQRVEPGAVLGRAGTQEQPLGPGLWFAVFEKGREQNPAQWLGAR